MNDSPESLQRKIQQSDDLGAVVRTMKAISASNISQYQKAAKALESYYQTVLLGIQAYLRNHDPDTQRVNFSRRKDPIPLFLVFGSDQGLVGPFNQTISEFASGIIRRHQGRHLLWVVGERVRFIMEDSGFRIDRAFNVPNSVGTITSLVGNLLANTDDILSEQRVTTLYPFFNRPHADGYTPVVRQLLPIEQEWSRKTSRQEWPSNNIPQLIGDPKATFSALFREYLFTSLYRACAFSMTSENTSRLNAMHRAEKNIGDLQTRLRQEYHELRQNAIDAELFDVIAGFNALKR